MMYLRQDSFHLRYTLEQNQAFSIMSRACLRILIDLIVHIVETFFFRLNSGRC